jgi:alanine racemase
LNCKLKIAKCKLKIESHYAIQFAIFNALQGSMRPAWIEIDLDAISHNVQQVRRFVGADVRVMAVVKANGYGHGLVESARAALEGGASSLGVALLDEALALRQAGIDAPLLVLGCGLPEHAPDLVRRRIAQVVSDPDMPVALSREAVRQGRPAHIHVKVDTGMGRVGCPVSDAPAFLRQVASLPNLTLEGVATHFPQSDAARLPDIEAQLARFLKMLDRLEGSPIRCRHAASSAVTTLLPRAHLDTVRVGLLVYGIPPLDGPCPIPLRPALTLKARITQVKPVPAGWPVSYGETFVTRRPSRLAIVPVGYADGYPRRLSNCGEVLIRGRRCPIRGRVCMDQCVVDVTDLRGVSVGDEAVLLGEQGMERISVWDLTRAIDGAPHEIVACLSPRLPRIIKNREEEHER